MQTYHDRVQKRKERDERGAYLAGEKERGRRGGGRKEDEAREKGGRRRGWKMGRKAEMVEATKAKGRGDEERWGEIGEREGILIPCMWSQCHGPH